MVATASGLTQRERGKIVMLYALIIITTITAFFMSTLVASSSAMLAGLGVVAFVFGLRHGVDADHIVAIDNTTRKLMQGGKKPLTVGTWFSLGHSTVVVGLIVALVLSTRSILSYMPILRSEGTIFGTAVSGAFLLVLGLINLVVALGIYKLYKEMRRGSLDASGLEHLLEKRGFMNRFLAPLFKVVDKPWHAYPMGFLFGLGFDTASEIAIIAISVGVAVSSSVSIWMILVLPFMFTCGMVLVDTSDGVVMRVAYGWSARNPIRKIHYNLTLTIISVLTAFVIGAVEVSQVISTELGLSGAFWVWLNGLDFETMGLGIIVVFGLSWFVSFIAYQRVFGTKFAQ